MSEETNKSKPRLSLPIIVPRGKKVIQFKQEPYHRTGTSGYSYDHWTSDQFAKYDMEGFYPPGTRKDKMFNHYQKFLDFVEINNTFYGDPQPHVITNWYNSVPENFRFLVKANKYITHSKKLLDFDETFPRRLELYSNLKEKCVGILLQLPPNFECNARNLERIK